MNCRGQSKRRPICWGKLLSAHQGGAGRRCYGATCLTWNRSITRSTTLRLPRNNSSQEPWKRCEVLFLLGWGGGRHDHDHGQEPQPRIFIRKKIRNSVHTRTASADMTATFHLLQLYLTSFRSVGLLLMTGLEFEASGDKSAPGNSKSFEERDFDKGERERDRERARKRESETERERESERARERARERESERASERESERARERESERARERESERERDVRVFFSISVLL